MNTALKNKYIGDRGFYERTAHTAVPLALNSALQSTMSTVDTLMVSWIGMVSAVGTASQINTLSGMINYGIVGGIGMFAAQFFGAEDYRNLKRALGLCLSMTLANAFLWYLAAMFFGRQILTFYMNDPAIVADGLRYLSISVYALFPGAVTFSFSNMFRSTGQAKLTLRISIATALMNVGLNACLIFGLGPFPEMGVRGAALATVLASCAGALIYIVYSLRTVQPFIGTPAEMFRFDMRFVKPILSKILPLIINESTFGFGQTLFVKAFGKLGKEQMDAYYVGNQIFNLMSFIIYGYGNAVQVLLGQLLGAGKIDQAKKEKEWHMGLSFLLSAVMIVFLIVFAVPLVSLFRLNDSAAQKLAVTIVYVFALKTSMRLFNFVIFCILRSGGDSAVIQFLDSGLEWAVGLPAAFACVDLFHMSSIALVLLVSQLEQLVRLILGMKRVNTNIWAKDLTKLVQERE